VRLSTRLGRIVMSSNERLARRRDRLVAAALRTAAGRDYFEHMRYRPSQRYTAGAVLPDSGRPVGVPIPQPRVFDSETHRTALLDEVTGSGWTLLAVDVPAAEHQSARDLVSWLDPYFARVVTDERLPSDGAPTLVDLDGGLDAAFAAYRGAFVLVRPDRFVAAAWAPGRTPLDWSALRVTRSVAAAAR
jgi:3-(3-hydroxy-phenyl)propionate hydroxylase